MVLGALADVTSRPIDLPSGIGLPTSSLNLQARGTARTTQEPWGCRTTAAAGEAVPPTEEIAISRRNAGNNRHTGRRLTTETKAAYKTTELVAFVAAVVGVLIASYVVKTNDNHADYFRADRAWFNIVLLTIGYLVSRGLAKAGSYDPYDADDANNI